MPGHLWLVRSWPCRPTLLKHECRFCEKLDCGSLCLASEKAMAPYSSTLAWKIPWTEEPGGLQSMRPLRVGHNWETSLSLFTFMLWRRKWQPTPVFLPGESQGRGSLVSCRLWVRTESDMTEVTQQQQQQHILLMNWLLYHMMACWDVPGRTVVKTLRSQCRGHGLGPLLGN